MSEAYPRTLNRLARKARVPLQVEAAQHEVVAGGMERGYGDFSLEGIDAMIAGSVALR